MPSRIAEDRLSEAVLQFVQESAYPEDEDVVSAELPPSALTSLSKLLDQARIDVKASIRELSRISAPDIDGWISQAKQLRDEIEDSQKLAHSITAGARRGEEHDRALQDAKAKVDLLDSEVVFNDTLASTLQRVHDVQSTLDGAEKATADYKLMDAIANMRDAERLLKAIRSSRATRLTELLQARITDLSSSLEHAAVDCWDSIIQLDKKNSALSIQQDTHRISKIELSTVIAALSKLDLLETSINKLARGVETVTLRPRLQADAQGRVAVLLVTDEGIQLDGLKSSDSVQSLLSDVSSVIEYLDKNLPQNIARRLSEHLMPNLTSRLVSGPLLSSVPADLAGIGGFKGLLGLVTQFADLLASKGWHGKDELVKWVSEAPNVWLRRRRERSLEGLRKIFAIGLSNPRAAERIETQVVSQEDKIFATEGGNDDWNAKWDDEDNEQLPTAKTIASDQGQNGADEEDMSAWGLDEDVASHKPEKFDQPEEGEDEADAWGWGDDAAEGNISTAASPAKAKTAPPNSNGRNAAAAPRAREITLKETYYITAVPDEILELISQVISDYKSLSHSNSVPNPIKPALPGLLTLPGLMLSLYRATAPNFYACNSSGNMFIYNDSLYMAEQLRKLAQDEILPHKSGETAFGSDISALELFGKRAYGKEMDSQRTILSDLLDGAQDFSSCTEPPFAHECDVAISSVVDRLRELHKQWTPVLSHSALLQSTGSLLSTVVNKIIVDIGDMNDISEPESQKLASFCNRIALLEDLFLPEQADKKDTGEAPLPRTAIYVPNWLKFQFLSNILESSLVDIKYLWTEGELSLEYGVNELVDLIEALFSDSEHRRRAIAEIKRSGRGRYLSSTLKF